MSTSKQAKFSRGLVWTLGVVIVLGGILAYLAFGPGPGTLNLSPTADLREAARHLFADENWTKIQNKQL